MKTKIPPLFILCASIYALQSLGGLPGLSLFLYLKEHLGLSEVQIMNIGFYISLCWIIKPMFAPLIDNLFTHKIWIILSLMGSIVASILFSISPFLTIPIVIAIGSFGSLCGMFRDISIDATSCISGKENDNNHTLQSIQWGSLFIASVFVGLAGGWLADHVNYKLAYLYTIPFYLAVIYIVSKIKSDKKINICSECRWEGECIDEMKDASPAHTSGCYSPKTLWKTLKSYGIIFKDKHFILIGIFLFLYTFSPSFGTPLSFRMRDLFHWTGLQMGVLDAVCSISAIIGMILFAKFIHLIPVKKVLYVSILVGASLTLGYLWFTPTTAFILGALGGVIGSIINLVLLTWAAKISIKNKEATSFALLCGILNGSSSASLWAGKTLLPIVGFNWLVVIAAFTSFLCLPLLRFIDEK